MSMSCFLRRVSPDVLAVIKSQPDEAAKEEMAFPANAILRAGADPEWLDLDKSWHGLHFVYSKTDWTGSLPEGFLLAGEPFTQSTDYGPYRSLSPQDTHKVSEWLANLSVDHVANHHDAEVMDATGIYPNRWVRDGEHGVTELTQDDMQLRAFMAAAAADNQAVLLFII